MPVDTIKLCECGCGQPAPLATKNDPEYGYVRGEPKRFVHGHSTRGELNSRWNGDDVSYNGVHLWLRKYKTRNGVCEECGVAGYTEFANISGEYRRDVEDYRELCKNCHVSFDRKVAV